MSVFDSFTYYINDLGDSPDKYKDHVLSGTTALCGRLNDRAEERATGTESIAILTRDEYITHRGLDALTTETKPDQMCADCWNRIRGT